MALARALTWGTTKMSEKMMAASRGNRLSGCTEEEAMLVSATPFHEGPGQAHEAVEFPRPAQFTDATQDGQNQGFSPSPSGQGEQTQRSLSDAHLQCQLTAQFGALASGKEIL